MSNFLNQIPEMPVADWVESLMDVVTESFSGAFKFIQNSVEFLMESMTDILVVIPPIVFILIIALLAFLATGKKLGLAVFSILGLLFIYNQ